MGADGVDAVVAAQGHVKKQAGLTKIVETCSPDGLKVVPLQADQIHLLEVIFSEA